MLNSTFEYARKNLIKIRVYIKDPYAAKYVTEEKITKMSFVGGVGGILGIFLGFSFISSVEVLFFVFCKLFPHFATKQMHSRISNGKCIRLINVQEKDK